MGHYEKSKIYLIKNRNDEDKVYVGSTIRNLHTRFMEHKSKYINFNKNKSKKKLYQSIECWDDWYIELFEDYPCDNKEELLKKEKEVIKLYGTLNIVIPTRDKKEYHLDNKNKKREYDLEYRKEREKNTLICECGGKYKPRHKSTHYKTKLHLDYLNAKKNNTE